MPRYRIHMTDRRGQFIIGINADNPSDAYDYATRTFPNAEIREVEEIDPPPEIVVPKTPIPGFTRDELILIVGALDIVKPYWEDEPDLYGRAESLAARITWSLDHADELEDTGPF